MARGSGGTWTGRGGKSVFDLSLVDRVDPRMTSIVTSVLTAASASVLVAPSGISLCRITRAHLQPALAIETASYPADEAADEEKLALRIAQAPEYFWGAFAGDVLRGFVCGTLTTATDLTDESMSMHEPTGETLCIHSVVVDAEHRRQGLATWMLRSYIERVSELGVPKRIVLICKEYLLGFYESCGFVNRGPSDVVHGQDPWILMELTLKQE